MVALMRNPKDMRLLDDRQFELLVAELLASQGYREIALTPRRNDGGKDIIAWQLIDGVPSVVYVECKRYPDGKPKIESVRALLGTIESDQIQRGIFVTSGRFTKGGREFITKNSDRLDGKEYQDLLSGSVGQVVLTLSRGRHLFASAVFTRPGQLQRDTGPASRPETAVRLERRSCLRPNG